MCWRNGIETNFKTRVLKFSLSKNYAMKTLETRYLDPSCGEKIVMRVNDQMIGGLTKCQKAMLNM